MLISTKLASEAAGLATEQFISGTVLKMARSRICFGNLALGQAIDVRQFQTLTPLLTWANPSAYWCSRGERLSQKSPDGGGGNDEGGQVVG